MTTRKIIAIPLTRKKYQEKVSNPPPAGRGPYPVEIRISDSAPSFFTSGLLAQTDSREVEDGCNHKVAHGDEAENGEHHDGCKHGPLIAYSLRPEVDQDDAYTIEAMVEDGSDECQRDDTDRREAEEGNAFIVDFRPEAQERDVHDMDKQE